MIAAFSTGVSGHVVLGVMKCVGVRQTGQVRRACVGVQQQGQEQDQTTCCFTCRACKGTRYSKNHGRAGNQMARKVRDWEPGGG